MIHQKLLIFVEFMLISTIAFPTAINTENIKYITINYNLPNYTVPLHYDVQIILDFDKNILIGECNITINILGLMKNITIHAGIFPILNIVLIDHFLEEEIYIPKYLFINKPNMFVIDFANSSKRPFLLLGKYTLKMTYIHYMNDNINVFSQTLHQKLGKMLIATGNNNNDKITIDKIMKARQLFPCWDESTFQTSFKISIKHHKKYTALSNIPRQETVIDKNNMILTHFKNSSFMPIQHLKVLITSFTIIFSHANVTFWCRENMKQYVQFASNIFQQVLYFLEKQIAIEILEMNYIVFPDIEYSSVETYLILQREEDITYNEKLHLDRRKMEVAHLMTRQMTLICYGKAFLWSKDGFATFLGLYILDKTFPHYRPMDLFVVEIQQELYRLDNVLDIYLLTLNSISNISEINLLRFPPSYSKLLVTWRMLYHIMTDNVFWMGINTYINIQHNLTNATDTNNLSSIVSFWTAMESALNVTNNTLNFNMKDFIDTSTKTHCPVLYVESNYIYNLTVISYINFQHALLNNMRFYQIYVTYTTKSIMNFETSNNTKKFVWLSSLTPHYHVPEVDENDWIIVNLQQAGYYRVNYDSDNWKKLANYLYYETYTKIHVLNRAQIIDDAFYFFKQKKLNFTMFWNITRFLLRDTDYVAWYPMIKVVEYLTCIWPVQNTKVIKDKINEMFERLLENIGYNDIFDQSHFTNRLREEAIKWACIFDAPKCRAVAIFQLETHLESSVQDQSLKWKEWVYCKGLMGANISTWRNVWTKWKATSDNTLLEYLTCSTHHYSVKFYLSLTKTDEFYLRVANGKIKANIVLHIIAKHAKNNAVLDYIFEHLELFDLSTKRHVDKIAVLIVIITHEHDNEQFKKVSEFIKYDLNEYLPDAVEQKIKKRKQEYSRQVKEYKSSV